MTKKQHDQLLCERDSYAALIPAILACPQLATLVEASRRFSFHTSWSGKDVGEKQREMFSSAMKPFTRAVGYMTPAQCKQYKELWKSRLFNLSVEAEVEVKEMTP